MLPNILTEIIDKDKSSKGTSQEHFGLYVTSYIGFSKMEIQQWFTLHP